MFGKKITLLAIIASFLLLTNFAIAKTDSKDKSTPQKESVPQQDSESEQIRIIDEPEVSKIDPVEEQKKINAMKELYDKSRNSEDETVRGLAEKWKLGQIGETEFAMGVVEQTNSMGKMEDLAESEAKMASDNFHRDLQIRLWDNYYDNPKKMHTIKTFRRDCFRYFFPIIKKKTFQGIRR
jgi:hypothetical protein